MKLASMGSERGAFNLQSEDVEDKISGNNRKVLCWCPVLATGDPNWLSSTDLVLDMMLRRTTPKVVVGILLS
jgi:hypothetical protein